MGVMVEDSSETGLEVLIAMLVLFQARDMLAVVAAREFDRGQVMASSKGQHCCICLQVSVIAARCIANESLHSKGCLGCGVFIWSRVV